MESMQISGNLFAMGFALAGHPEMTLHGQIPTCHQPIFPQSQNTEKNVLETFCTSLAFYYWLIILTIYLFIILEARLYKHS